MLIVLLLVLPIVFAVVLGASFNPMGQGFSLFLDMLMRGGQNLMLGQDYGKAEAAAAESNRMHRGAIGAASTAAGSYRDQASSYAEGGRGTRATAIGSTARSQEGNVADWIADYWKRGYKDRTEGPDSGMGGAAKGLADDYWGKLMGGLGDSALGDANVRAKQTLAEIPAYQKEFGRARGEGYGTLGDIREDRDLLKSEYTGTKAELRGRLDEYGEKFMSQRAGYEIASVMQPLLAQKANALQELENARWSGNMSDDEFLARKADIEATATQQAQTAASAKQSELNELVAATTGQLEQGFQAASASMFGSLGASLTGLDQAATATIQGIHNSLEAETTFINDAVRNATVAGAAYMDVISEGASQYMGVIERGMMEDVRNRRYAEVDAPNAILDMELNATLQSEYAYTADMFKALDYSAQFTAMGLDMQFAYSEMYASMSPYMQTVIDNNANAFGMQSQYRSMGDARSAANRANELGWGQVGVSAASTGAQVGGGILSNMPSGGGSIPTPPGGGAPLAPPFSSGGGGVFSGGGSGTPVGPGGGGPAGPW